ncbi:MAG: porin, partial [Oceanobacter sp.]
IGIDNVNAGTEDDGANGRDYLSRVGVKSTTKLSNGLTAMGQVEYGLRGSDFVNSSQMNAPTLRLLTVGIKGDFGTLTYGSQVPLFHKFVRGAYFSDGNDTVRLGTVRDDDLTNYVYKSGGVTLGAGIQTEGQDGDSIDSINVGGEYKAGSFKLQAAAIKDRRGDNTGTLMGARVWYSIDNVTLSAFRHQQNEDFDLYNGSTGNVRLRGASVNGNVNGIGNCSGEARANTGVYAAYKLGSAKVHARYAIDSCEDAGDITSTKVEYVNSLAKNYKYWVSHEVLSSDDARTPSTGDDMSETQIGIRYDF